MKGLSTILHHKKWCFAYLVTGLSFWRLESTDIAQIMVFLIPFVLGASSFDKSTWKKSE